MNGMQTRQGEDVDQKTMELEPMCSSRDQNSTKPDGVVVQPTATDSDRQDAAATDVDDGKWTTFGDILERFVQSEQQGPSEGDAMTRLRHGP